MLHVTFNELPARRKQNVCPRDLRPRIHERHRILKLIAEAESPAGLIEPRAGPKAAAQGLVWQPPIQKEVSGKNWRSHLQHAERRIPRLARHSQGLVYLIPVLIAADDRPCLFGASGFSQEENDFHLSAAFEGNFKLKRSRWI